MDRAEKVGIGVAAAGHVLLFGLLSAGFLATPNPIKLEQHPVEVSLVPEVAPTQAAPAPAPPAPSVAPEQGPPEDAPPPVEAPAPRVAPPPPKPEPTPEPVKPVAKPAPAPKPAPVRPKPKPSPPAAEPEPSKPKPSPPAAEPALRKSAKPAEKPAPAAPSKPAKPAKPAPNEAATGGDIAAKPSRPKGSRLGADFLKGLAPDAPTRPSSKPAAAPGPVMNAQAAADIGSAIKRQVQPCANRQVTPGPGAERIRVAVNLRLNKDGSLAAPPRIVSHDGVDDDNRRYLDRVDDLAIAAFTGCSPLKGLPSELYEVQGGWRNFTLRYKLPG